MNTKIAPKIICHIIKDKKYFSKIFKVNFSFLKNEAFDMSTPFNIKSQYFGVLKDKIRTKIVLELENIKIEFPIILYYGENHINIFISKNIGVCYEIINQLSYENKEGNENKENNEINEITFQYESHKYIISHFDTFGNKYRKRFLAVNVPINIDLNNINFQKIKNLLSYKISIFPSNNVLVQEIKTDVEHKSLIIEKDIKDFINKNVPIIFDNKITKEERNKLYKEINNKISPHKEYFRQDLIKLKNKDWEFTDYTLFYNYYRFSLLALSENNNVKIKNYFKEALKQFEKINLELFNFQDQLTNYEKILALFSLYHTLILDGIDKYNKDHICGEYFLLDTKNFGYKSYELAFNFITNIIKNLREDSLIFYPILQANSGFSKNINSEDEKEIFEISMLNIENIKTHLSTLIPRIIFRVRNRALLSKRGLIIKTSGGIFVYETTIFNNNIGLDYDEFLQNHPEDTAILISFTILHELFMHKKLRDNEEYISGKETPGKFIGKKFKIENFYYTNIKNNLDCLSIYTDDKKKLKTSCEDGECGKMFEYFFEEPNNHIIYILKNYLGFSDLLNKVDLVVQQDLKELQKYVIEKSKNNEIVKLVNTKTLGNKLNRNEGSNEEIEEKDIAISDNNNNSSIILDEYIQEILKSAKIQI